jgi:hypothetical protein
MNHFLLDRSAFSYLFVLSYIPLTERDYWPFSFDNCISKVGPRNPYLQVLPEAVNLAKTNY